MVKLKHHNNHYQSCAIPLNCIILLTATTQNIAQQYPQSKFILKKPFITNNIFPIMYLIIISLYTLIILLEFKYFQQYGTLKQNKNIIRISRIIFMVLFYIHEAFYFAIGFFMLINLKIAMSSQKILFIMIPLGLYMCFYAIHSIIFASHRLFGYFSCFLASLILFTQNQNIYILILVYTVYIYYKQKGRLDKLFYSMIGMVIFWNYLNQYEASSTDIRVIGIISLSFILFTMIIIYVLKSNANDKDYFFQDNKRMLRWFMASQEKIKESEDLINDELGQFQEYYLQKYGANVNWDKYVDNEDKNYQYIASSKYLHAKAAEKTQYEIKQIIWENIKLNRSIDNSQQVLHLFLGASFSLQLQMENSFRQLKDYLKYKIGGLYQNYTAYKCLKRMLETSNNKMSDSFGIQVCDIINNDSKIKQIHRKFKLIINANYQFWLQIFQNSYQMSDQLFNKFSQIVNNQQQLKELLRQVKQNNQIYHDLTIELQVAEQLDKLTERYIQRQLNRAQNVKKTNQPIYEFIILDVDHKTQCLSSYYSRFLSPDEPLQSVMDTLLPHPFEQYFLKKQQQFDANLQSQTFILPIFTSKNTIQAVQCTLHLTHKNSQLKYIMQISPLFKAGQKYFIYNSNINKIIFINKALKEYFHLNLDRNKDLLSIKDLFQCQKIQILLIEYLKETNIVEIKLNIKKIAQLMKEGIIEKTINNDSIMNIIKGSNNFKLQMRSRILFSQQQYLIISLVEESVPTTINSVSSLKLPTVKSHLEIMQRQLEIQCNVRDRAIKILNQINLKFKFNAKSYVSLILLTFLLMILGFVANIYVYNYFNSSDTQAKLNILAESQHLNHQFINLMHLISNSFTNKLFMSHQSQAQAFISSFPDVKNASLSLNQLKQYFTDLKDSFISQILKSYGLQKQKQYLIPTQQYKIQFDNFAIQIKNHESVFYDYMTAIQAGFKNQEQIKFLVKNYNSLIQSVNKYQKKEEIKINELSSSQIEISNTILLISIGILIIVQFITKIKIYIILNSTLNIFRFIKKQQFVTIIEDIHSVEKSIQRKVNPYDFKQLRYKMQQLQQVKQDSLIFVEEQKKRGEYQQIKSAIKLAYKDILLFFIILGCGIGINKIQISTVQDHTAYFYKVLNLKKALYLHQIELQENYIYMFQKQYAQQYFNITSLKNPVRHIHDLISLDLPPMLHDYISSSQIICKKQYLSSIKIPVFNKNPLICNQEMHSNGIKFYNQIFNIYLKLLKQQRNIKLNMFFSSNSSNKFAQILYAKQLLDIYIDSQKEQYLQLFNKINHTKTKQNEAIVNYNVILIVIITVIYGYGLWDILRRTFLVKKMIGMLPLTIFDHLQMNQYRIVSDLVQKLKRL